MISGQLKIRIFQCEIMNNLIIVIGYFIVFSNWDSFDAFITEKISDYNYRKKTQINKVINIDI